MWSECCVQGRYVLPVVFLHESPTVLPAAIVFTRSLRSRRGAALRRGWNVMSNCATHSLTYSLALRQHYQQKRKVR